MVGHRLVIASRVWRLDVPRRPPPGRGRRSVQRLTAGGSEQAATPWAGLAAVPRTRGKLDSEILTPVAGTLSECGRASSDAPGGKNGIGRRIRRGVAP